MDCEKCGTSVLGVGFGRLTGIESRVSLRSLWALRLAPSWARPMGTSAPSVRTERFALF